MRILIVEDDAGIASGLAATLKGAGYAVDICDNLARAGAALRTESFDMALLDLGLPDGDGIDWLRSLRQEGRMLPVLIMTARDALTDRITGLDLCPRRTAGAHARGPAPQRGPGIPLAGAWRPGGEPGSAHRAP